MILFCTQISAHHMTSSCTNYSFFAHIGCRTIYISTTNITSRQLCTNNVPSHAHGWRWVFDFGAACKPMLRGLRMTRVSVLISIRMAGARPPTACARCCEQQIWLDCQDLCAAVIYGSQRGWRNWIMVNWSSEQILYNIGCW